MYRRPAESASGRGARGAAGTRHGELLVALGAGAGVTALYAVAYAQRDALPAASSLVGHGIGVAGFVLMLLTATLYSLRKLRTGARWGSTAWWLKCHMVTGLVGPYMVLLHTAFQFRGLAGLTTVLMLVVVASGLVGRFIYTRVQRTAVGGITAQRRALAAWHLVHLPLTWALFAAAFVHVAAALYYATLQR